MLGAIFGDIVGSQFEFTGFNEYNFNLFTGSCNITDDSLMTLAVANALLVSKNDKEQYQSNLISYMKKIAHDHPNTNWGERFYNWLFIQEHPVPIYSYGNGAAMRISPVGWVCDTLEETIELSRLTTEVSHNHIEGIKGAEAVAVAIFMARTGSTKEQIKAKMVEYYPELSDMTIKGLKMSGYGLDDEGRWVTCQGSVPQAICAFLESNSFEDAIRKAISLGADSDTQACITGSIAEAYYGLSYKDEDMVMPYLTEDLKSIYYAFDTIKKKRIRL